MFEVPTVVVLGAGASCHYGYPTGEGLVSAVIVKAHQFGTFCEISAATKHGQSLNQFLPDFVERLPESNTPRKWLKAKAECDKLRKRLQIVNPPVIDHFLNDNPSLQEIGKLIVALVILECEARYSADLSLLYSSGNPREVGDWCRYLAMKLTRGCQTPADLQRNLVTFVTFNYDVSLETQLAQKLLSTEITYDETLVGDFVAKSCLHVYGAIRDSRIPAGQLEPKIFESPSKDDDAYRQSYQGILDMAHTASKNIRTIAPVEKISDTKTIEAARTAIGHAHQVFILGYGFDETNSEILKLSSTLCATREMRGKKQLYATNLNRTPLVDQRLNLIVEEVNKESRNSGHHLLAHAISGRNVYESLRSEFPL